jgi:hypothetical protein
MYAFDFGPFNTSSVKLPYDHETEIRKLKSMIFPQFMTCNLILVQTPLVPRPPGGFEPQKETTEFMRQYFEWLEQNPFLFPHRWTLTKKYHQPKSAFG